MAIEACWNWGAVFEVLEDLPEVSAVVVANPLKARLIGEAQIKTDKIDRRFFLGALGEACAMCGGPIRH